MSVFQKSLGFGLGNILAALVPLALLPFLTSHFSKEEMGTIALYETLILILTPLITFGIDGAIAANFFRMSDRQRKVFGGNILRIPVVMGFLLLLSLWGLLSLGVLPSYIQDEWYLLLVPLIILNSLGAFAYSHLQMSSRVGFYVSIKIVTAIVSACVTVILVLSTEVGLVGRLIGLYLASLVLGLFAVRVINEEGYSKQKYSHKDIKAGWKFGVGMVFHSWSAVIFLASDRLVLSYTVTPGELGLYFVASQIGLVMSLIQTTFSQVWTPLALRLLSEGKLHQLQRFSRFSLLILLVGCLGGIPFIEIAYYFFIDPEYASSKPVTYLILISYLFLGFYKVYVVHFFHRNRTDILALISTTTAVLNVSLTIVFSIQYGIIGAAVATCISSFVFFSLVYFSVYYWQLKEATK